LPGRDAIAEWARLTDGWLGRPPDYKAALTARLAGNNGFYEPCQESPRRWYRYARGGAAHRTRAAASAGRSQNRKPVYG